MMASATNLRARPLSHPLAIRFSTPSLPQILSLLGSVCKDWASHVPKQVAG